MHLVSAERRHRGLGKAPGEDQPNKEPVDKGRQQETKATRGFRDLQWRLRSLPDLLHCGRDVTEELEETKEPERAH
ncbi:hypothetical protein GDO81_014679 [Engystomops pustulosus]|uniref:Uncharacterized protein n=1 Tax=Engystomops pustulosus TaxID=76066 RepID=A0AAV7BBW5_ENGPU|nr:hypothetical protein GDO81_014679 [Engystomops pustulosus]